MSAGDSPGLARRARPGWRKELPDQAVSADPSGATGSTSVSAAGSLSLPGNASARGIRGTVRAKATFSGGTRPAGSPDPGAVLATAIEAFQRVYLGGIQERCWIGVGGSGQIVEGRAEGKTDGEIRRCVKRYLARRRYRHLNTAAGSEIGGLTR